jgi:hypothetical protein
MFGGREKMSGRKQPFVNVSELTTARERFASPHVSSRSISWRRVFCQIMLPPTSRRKRSYRSGKECSDSVWSGPITETYPREKEKSASVLQGAVPA